MALPDSEDRAKAIIAAMESIEADYENLRGVLLNKILKDAVARVEPALNVGSHTMRTTWGYHAHQRHIPLGTIMDKLGHRSPSVTLRYLGINDDEVKRATLELNL